MEFVTVISGKVSSIYESDFQNITNIAQNRYRGYEKSYHEWIDKIDDVDYKRSIDRVRFCDDIVSKIQERFPDCRIENVAETDEIYWAVSPKNAKGADRSLVDCHYDAPYGIIPTKGVIFYRVIVGVNENNTVTTHFPKEDIRVKMTTGDFHGLDFNKDFHCVNGSIEEGKFRILLKINYLIVPKGSEKYSCFVRKINVNWMNFSREAMRMGADPKNLFEKIVGFGVNFSRVVFNNWVISLVIFVLILVIIFKIT
jgi:hypothetical protein